MLSSSSSSSRPLEREGGKSRSRSSLSEPYNVDIVSPAGGGCAAPLVPSVAARRDPTLCGFGAPAVQLHCSRAALFLPAAAHAHRTRIVVAGPDDAHRARVVAAVSSQRHAIVAEPVASDAVIFDDSVGEHAVHQQLDHFVTFEFLWLPSDRRGGGN